MSCNCLNEIRENWTKQDESINYVRFDNSGIISSVDGKVVARNKTGQGVEIGFWHTKKNGDKVQKSKKSFIVHNFCPFCGKSYDPVEENTTSKTQPTNQ